MEIELNTILRGQREMTTKELFNERIELIGKEQESIQKVVNAATDLEPMILEAVVDYTNSRKDYKASVKEDLELVNDLIDAKHDGIIFKNVQNKLKVEWLKYCQDNRARLVNAAINMLSEIRQKENESTLDL